MVFDSHGEEASIDILSTRREAEPPNLRNPSILEPQERKVKDA
jgi:hypothetical protein